MDSESQDKAKRAEGWEDFIIGYQKLMLQMWQDAFLSQPRIEQAMLDALKTWHLPSRIEQEETIAALERANARLDALQQKVEMLESRLGQVKKLATRSGQRASKKPLKRRSKNG